MTRNSLECKGGGILRFAQDDNISGAQDDKGFSIEKVQLRTSLRVITSFFIRALVYSLYKNNVVLHEDQRKRE
jgi:hypothetical protein